MDEPSKQIYGSIHGGRVYEFVWGQDYHGRT